ncbi:HEX1 [Candida jiufengensis]|uniref:HEX1 n=1 Tax=Candida jiufengensis TaxID=497108 RepID=UPI0022247B49|nr:HEX1 [Candida jiufengensis]KAI5956611.1 HEX1 [Candida jiufengensis]
MLILLLFYIIQIFALQVDPLPKPQFIKWYGQPLIVDLKNLYLVGGYDILDKALSRVKQRNLLSRIEKDTFFQFLPLKIEVLVEENETQLQIDVDESYELNISSDRGVVIKSETIWGALRAISTFQQLLVTTNGMVIIEQSVLIKDSPKFPHRGLMIDSARNFLTMDSILEQIDIMELVKMNVLHWHLVDTQSWPLILKSHPEMSNDAFSNDEKYTMDDLKFIQNYANERGVIIIPEIDMPGHARAGWRQIDNDLVVCGDCFWKGFAVEPPPGQLNLLNNKIYDVIDDVFKELRSLFTTIHVGNDELQESCFPQEWFNNKSLNDLVQHYIDKTSSIFSTANIIMWDDIVQNHNAKIPQNVILQVWHEQGVIKELTNKGHKVIVSSADHLYLDCGHGGFLTNDKRYIDKPENDKFNSGQAGSWCGPYKTYQRIYSFDFLKNLTEEEKELVIGAEAALWSEQVDSNVLTSMIWPRAAALSELLWSGHSLDGLREFTPRIFRFRELLAKLNYKVPPLASKYCLLSPNACNYDNY